MKTLRTSMSSNSCAMAISKRRETLRERTSSSIPTVFDARKWGKLRNRQIDRLPRGLLSIAFVTCLATPPYLPRDRTASANNAAILHRAPRTETRDHPSAAADTRFTLASETTVGLHNAYEPAGFKYLAQALDTGTGMIELDVWGETIFHEWKVSHTNPLGNQNNCVHASSADQLYSGSANEDLESCLDNIRLWLGAHPGSGPLIVKIELKAGFSANLGMGPAWLDTSVRNHLGSIVYRPADLLAKPDGGQYATLDEAARAGNWPDRAHLAGKVILEIIPGTFEESNPFDTLGTDVEYSRYLRDLVATGNEGQAQIFPSVHGAAAGDPRDKYTDASIRPWFVVFDGDASAFVRFDTAWYDVNHYLVLMTDAQNVAPAISTTNPSEAEARARVTQLAAAHATVVSSDWRSLPGVQSLVPPRG